MNRTAYALILLICLLAPLRLSAQVNLSNTTDMSELPFIIARPNGQVIAAWTEGHFNGWGVIWYRIRTESAGWSEAQIAAERYYSAAFPQMAVDSSGNVHMAYMDGNSSGNREIYYKKYVGGRWTSPEQIYYSAGLNSSWPRIAVEGSRIYIAWCHNYTPAGVTRNKLDIYLQEKTDGGSWPSTPQIISLTPDSVSVHPFLAVRNGNVYSAWMDDNHAVDNWNIYYNSRINGYWTGTVRLNPSSNQYCPALAVDGNGVVHLIYSNKGNPVWYQQKNSSGWTSPVVISTAKTSVQSMLFMKYSHGMLHALWRQREGEGNYIFYARGSASGAWETPFRVSHGGESEYPGLDLDKDGKVHIVYSDIGRGGERDVFYVNLEQLTSFPVASFTAAPLQGDPPLAVSFDASASYDPDGQIVSYKWDFGDGGTGSGVTASHTYTKRGAYTAELTVTDDEKQESTGSCQIIVGSPPVAVISASPTSGGSPLTVYFDGSGSYDTDGSIVSYTWNFGDGTSGSGRFVEHTYTNYATRIATLVVKDNEGLEASDSIEIEITNDPIARIKYSPKSGQPPLKVNFDASNSKPADRNNGKVVSYNWDFGDGGSGSGAKPSHTYRKAGSYTVTLEITDNQDLKDSTTVEVDVYSKPTAGYTCSPMDGIAPLVVSFDATKSSDEDGHIVTYRWVFGDGTTGTGKTISHTYTKGGTFTVWLTVTDDDGWQDSTYKKVTVVEKPYPPLDFSVQNVVNRSLYFTDCLNILTWNHNSQNSGKIQVVKYIVYRRQKGSAPDFMYIGETGPDVSRFEDLSPADENEMKSYIYGIRAVDIYGRESDMRKVDAGK